MFNKIAERFENLSEIQQEQARKLFEDASKNDGYRYQNYNDNKQHPTGEIMTRNYVANGI